VKILLNVGERMQLLRILPATGDITTIRIVREVREALSFTSEEHKKYSISQSEAGDGRSIIKWNELAGMETKEVEISDKVCEMIKNVLVDMDRKNKLELNMIRFYEIFVEGIDSPPPEMPSMLYVKPIS